jgi:hypothetical protein
VAASTTAREGFHAGFAKPDGQKIKFCVHCREGGWGGKKNACVVGMRDNMPSEWIEGRKNTIIFT